MKQIEKRHPFGTTGSRSLEELDGEKWGEPEFGSYVVRTCHALRRKPLDALSDEELRLAVGQGLGLEWLVPLVLHRLTEDPFRAGDFFDGDLLVSLARVPASYWIGHPIEKAYLATEIIPSILLDDRLGTQLKEVRQAVAELQARS